MVTMKLKNGCTFREESGKKVFLAYGEKEQLLDITTYKLATALFYNPNISESELQSKISDYKEAMIVLSDFIE